MGKIRTTYEEATRLAGSGMLRLARVSSQEESSSIMDIEGDVNRTFGPTQYTSNGPVPGGDGLDTETPASRRRVPVPVEPVSIPTGSNPYQSNPVQSQPSSSTTNHEQSPVSKCVVCLDPLTTPVVTVICWHVHCESFSLQSLKVKKLCPRCTLITSFDDLRKVYL